MKKRVIYEATDGTTVEFIKIKNVPGWSHRVAVNNRFVAWMHNDFKPNAKNARFYANEYGPARDGAEDDQLAAYTGMTADERAWIG